MGAEGTLWHCVGAEGTVWVQRAGAEGTVWVQRALLGAESTVWVQRALGQKIQVIIFYVGHYLMHCRCNTMLVKAHRVLLP